VKWQNLSIIQFHPEELATIKGINMEKALRIGEAFAEQKELRDVVMFLQEYGISPSFFTKIYKQFGSDTIEKIRSNPYIFAEEIHGITFKTAENKKEYYIFNIILFFVKLKTFCNSARLIKLKFQTKIMLYYKYACFFFKDIKN